APRGVRGGEHMMATAQPLTYGQLLKHYRTAAHLTQEALAERAGLSARGISDVERGVRQAPYAHTIQALAQALAGRDCRSPQEVDGTLQAGVADWNQQPTSFLWGRPPKPKRHLKRQYVPR